jgi:hypothetical protein
MENIDEMQMVFEMEYVDWNGSVSFNKLIEDMQIANCTHIKTPAVMQLLLNTAEISQAQKDGLYNLYQKYLEVNLVVLIQDCATKEERTLVSHVSTILKSKEEET